MTFSIEDIQDAKQAVKELERLRKRHMAIYFLDEQGNRDPDQWRITMSLELARDIICNKFQLNSIDWDNVKLDDDEISDFVSVIARCK